MCTKKFEGGLETAKDNELSTRPKFVYHYQSTSRSMWELSAALQVQATCRYTAHLECKWCEKRPGNTFLQTWQ